MTEVLERILRAYGQSVTLTRAGETAEAKAFLQAMEEAGKAEPYAPSRPWALPMTGAGAASPGRLSPMGTGWAFRGGASGCGTPGRCIWAGELCHYEAILTAEREAAE